MPSLHLEAQGCQMNERDAERLAASLTALGWTLTDDPARADLILIHACSVRAKAAEHALGRLGQLSGLRRGNPGLLLGLTGCLAAHLGSKAKKRIPGINVIAGPGAVERLPLLVDGLTVDELRVDLDPTAPFPAGFDAAGDLRLPHPAVGPGAAFVTITEGCGNFCAYCIVPYLRGPLRCRPASAVLAEARSLIERGFNELILLGQNVNAYQYQGVGFAGLLESVAGIDGLRRLRFMTSHPKDLLPDVFDVIGQCQKVCEQLHLPLQSGSDAVLRRMGRGYTAERYRGLIAAARERVPGITLTTDVIVGFPGEDETDHRATLELLEWVGFDNAFMFKFSPRTGTRAAELPDDVPPAVKQRRFLEVQAVIESSAKARNAALVGQTLEIVIEGTDKTGRPFGRTRGGKNLKLALDAAVEPGDYVTARVEAASTFSLEGVIVSEA